MLVLFVFGLFLVFSFLENCRAVFSPHESRNIKKDWKREWHDQILKRSSRRGRKRQKMFYFRYWLFVKCVWLMHSILTVAIIVWMWMRHEVSFFMKFSLVTAYFFFNFDLHCQTSSQDICLINETEKSSLMVCPSLSLSPFFLICLEIVSPSLTRTRYAKDFISLVPLFSFFFPFILSAHQSF